MNDTAEYRASVGALSMHAVQAYNAGATGAGIKVAVIDSGIDLASDQFLGRVDPASQNTAGGSTVDDQDGHGTAVAFTIAGVRNGSGSHGVAFDATLLALRADTDGTCATECAFSDSAIARAINVASANGARVINISLGGSSPNSAVLQAIDRATAAGIIVVISAGNDGLAEPDTFTSPANQGVSHNLVIIAGSVGATDAISDFSNRAGASAAHYLAAVGERVRAPDHEGTVFLWSGTSMAAPEISGAVALLAQAFPNLTGTQIVNLLYSTARDVGAAGVDPVYGNGVLDLAKAFAPQGTLSVGTLAVASSLDNAVLSAAMGDARVAGGPLGAIVLDGYRRAYTLDLTRTIGRAPADRPLTDALGHGVRRYALTSQSGRVAVSIVPAPGGVAMRGLELQAAGLGRARMLAASASWRIGGNTRIAMASAQGTPGLLAELAGSTGPSFLLVRDPATAPGLTMHSAAGTALRHAFGRTGITIGVDSGEIAMPGVRILAGVRDRFDRAAYDRVALALDRRWGALSVTTGLSMLAEHGSVLGARFDGAFGRSHATTFAGDLATRLSLGDGWSGGAAWRLATTHARLSGGVEGDGWLTTSAFALDLGKVGVLGARDSLALGVAQPLRVTGGALSLRLPVAYSYADTAVSGWQTQRLNLTPTGREIDVEARYATPLLGGDLATNLFMRSDPGNRAGTPADVGAAVRFTLGL